MRSKYLKCRIYFSLADSVEFHAFEDKTRTAIRLSYNLGTIECTIDKLTTPRKDVKNLPTLSEEEYFQEMCVWDHELDIELIHAIQKYGYDVLYAYEYGSFTWDIELEY